MVISTTTDIFRFISVCFYESFADSRYFFERDYQEMPEYIKEVDFDMNKYQNAFIPSIQQWANEAAKELAEYGIKSTKVKGIRSPKEYNFYTDWADIDVEVDDNWDHIAVKKLDLLSKDHDCNRYFGDNFRSSSGYVFYGPESWSKLKGDLISNNPSCEMHILFGMYSTLAFVKEFGNIAEEKWTEITEDQELRYEDFATIELLIPDGTEYLFKDEYTAEADEIYHKVFDKFGWAWRHPKYKSKTELCAMLKWAKEKGMSIEELKGFFLIVRHRRLVVREYSRSRFLKQKII